MEDNQNYLVVIFDINPLWWAQQSCKTESSFENCLENVLIFCNSYMMMNHNNKLAFIACLSDRCDFLYPKSEQKHAEEENDISIVKDGKFEMFAEMNDIIINGVKNMLQSSDNKLNRQPGSDVPATLLTGALLKALCYINNEEKKILNIDYFKARILVLKGSPDASAQYMPIMNCIFAAQKKNIVIDSVSLLKSSSFLQQASDITGGICFNIEKLSGLVQYLLWIFLPDLTIREKLDLPKSVQIDYRAACFCHKRLVDIGFVCSVCLSIYCQFIPKCLTCQTKFKLPSLPMVKPKKKKK